MDRGVLVGDDESRVQFIQTALKSTRVRYKNHIIEAYQDQVTFNGTHGHMQHILFRGTIMN